MRLFVIRGFGIHRDSSGAEIDFDRIHSELIEPAMNLCGLSGGTTGQIVEAGNIRADMFALIVEADVVICDVTVHNANVFYELGIRHALRKKHTVLIRGNPTRDKTPFDLSTDRYLKYEIDDPGTAVPELVKAIQAGLNGQRETDSPVFQLLPHLSEADPADVTIVPVDFVEDVERAEASADRGWLRLLADEVRNERFYIDGLKIIARAQWNLKDYPGARTSWETVLNVWPEDIEANLALANIYERLYRESADPVLLEASNQSIRRVAGRQGTALNLRAEALALQGRNLKTLWRLEFSKLGTVAERRARALDRKLVQSYEAYLHAFYGDLNSFYPGLAALQSGTILRELSACTGWRHMFGGSEVKAQRYLDDLDGQLTSLRHIVATSITNALGNVDRTRTWAQVGEMDLLFLTCPEDADEEAPAAVVAGYRDAIPRSEAFVWDATKGQLELFAALGIRTRLAESVLMEMDARFPSKDKNPVHIVVFSGPAFHGSATSSNRFPANGEAEAEKMIRDRIEALKQEGEDLKVLASAACSADILVHEVCTRIGVESVLCLPLPVPVVAREAFAEEHTWLARFHALVKTRRNDTLVLGTEADDAHVPRWLRQTADDPWARGDRWLINLAESWKDAQRYTLMALWDGKAADRGAGHLVKLAQQSGVFAIDRIDSSTLYGQP